MTYLGYLLLYEPPWHRPERFSFGQLPPLQVAGPLFLLIGALCFLIGFCWWLCGLQLCSERLRHHQRHHLLPKRTVHRRPAQVSGWQAWAKVGVTP